MDGINFASSPECLFAYVARSHALFDTCFRESNICQLPKKLLILSKTFSFDNKIVRSITVSTSAYERFPVFVKTTMRWRPTLLFSSLFS